MNKRPLDKSKKSNIKCEHCKYWQARSTTDWFKRLFHCSNLKSPKVNKLHTTGIDVSVLSGKRVTK